MAEVRIADLVEASVRGDYQIPEFQREFVWRPAQVADFVDSLSAGYPVGCLVVWKPAAIEGKAPAYVVDGQQRITALCIMFGKRPSWKDDKEWRATSDTCGQHLNVSSDGGVSFGRKRGGWISLPISEILAKLSDDEVTNLVSQTLDATKITSDKARTALYEKAKEVWRIRVNALPIVEANTQDPMAVAEMYRRLNLLGTKIRETDTQLAFIAVRNPTWVKSVFRAFIKGLETNTNHRWSLEPGLLLRCMTILDSATPRVGDIKNPEEFWESGCSKTFQNVKDAIDDLLPRLERYGVYAADDVPSNYTLIALFAFHARFSKAKNYDLDAVLRWFVCANLTGRYGNAPLQRLTEDAQLFMKSDDPGEALRALEIPKDEISRALTEEFAEPFKRNTPGALVLKMILWDKGIDWRKGGKLSNYPPLEWHHIIPRKALRNIAAEDSVANNIANMTLLSEAANKEFKDQPPWVYAPNAIKDPTRLESHCITKPYAAAFTAGKPINKQDELAKFFTDRLKLIQREAKQLLGLSG
jgi:hypothetical protein